MPDVADGAETGDPKECELCCGLGRKNRIERAEDYVYILAPPAIEHNLKESLE